MIFLKNKLSRQKQFEILLILLGLFIMLLTFKFEIVSDAKVRFDAIHQFLSTGKILNPENPYSIIGPFFSIPLYFIGYLFKSPEYWCSYYNYLIFVLGLLAVYRLLRDTVDILVINKFVLILITASMYVYHVKQYFGEVFTSICYFIGIIAIVVNSSIVSNWGYWLLSIGTVNMPASLIGFSMVIFERTLSRKRLRILFFLIPTVLLYLIEAWICRGNPFISGYANNFGFKTIMPFSGKPNFSYPFFFGVNISRIFFWERHYILCPRITSFY